MNKMILATAVFGAAMLLGAANLRIASAKILAAQDEKALNSTVTEVLKQAENDNDKASLLMDAGARAVSLKLFEQGVKFYADAAALPDAAVTLKASAMQRQSWLLINRLNRKVEGVEVLKKLLAMNVPGYENSVNSTIASTIYYGGKGFNRKDAIPYYEATLKYPNNGGMFYVVRDRIENKKLAEAREILEKAKKQPNPSKSFTYDICNAEGELLHAEGKYDAAIASYSKLDKIYPDKHFTMVYYQYTVYRSAKNKEKAIECLKELQKSPAWVKMATNDLKELEKKK